MIKFNKWLVVACVATLMSLGINSLQAQDDGGGGGGRRRGGGPGGGGFGGGNFDPAEFQARRLERIRESLEVTKDEEWKVIEGRVTKVMDAQRGVIGFTRLGGFGRRGGGGGGRFGGEPVPEVEALQKAIEDKASTADIKTALEKYRTARKAKQDELKKAQDELKKVLSARQEAAAVMDGLLE